MIESARGAEHDCDYAPRLEWGPWESDGELERREQRRIPRCRGCGREQPSRTARRALREEVRARPTHPPPTANTLAREVAAKVLARGESRPTFRSLCSALKAPASAVEEALDDLLRAAWIGLTYRLDGTRRLVESVCVLDRNGLDALAHPGLRERRASSVLRGRERLRGIEHPIAGRAAEVLDSDEADKLSPDAIDALVEVARHAASGEVVARRVFSTRCLGDSKALERVASTVERLLEPLESLGLREGAAVTLVGGEGRLLLEDGGVDLTAFRPFLGLPREIVPRLVGVEAPAGGLFVVENLTAFEACCRAEVSGVADALVVWSAGWPGRVVKAFVERAASAGLPIRIWADLDLSGVRIARLVGEWASGTALPWKMESADLIAASVRRPLSPAASAAIRRDIASHSDAPLANTLRTMLELGEWAEQESMLGRAMSNREGRRRDGGGDDERHPDWSQQREAVLPDEGEP